MISLIVKRHQFHASSMESSNRVLLFVLFRTKNAKEILVITIHLKSIGTPLATRGDIGPARLVRKACGEVGKNENVFKRCNA